MGDIIVDAEKPKKIKIIPVETIEEVLSEVLTGKAKRRYSR